MADLAGDGWEEHDHEELVHSHEHFHVTHNHTGRTGGFEHLSSSHAHEHDHLGLRHSHLPHQDFDREHIGEAHVHDHAAPARRSRPTPRPAAKKATAKAK
jgi:hypothetical protein